MNAVPPVLLMIIVTVLAGCHAAPTEAKPLPGSSAIVERVGGRPFVFQMAAGTGFEWNAATSDPVIATIGPVRKRDVALSVDDGSGTRPVGSPQEWIFPVTFHRAGKVTLTFFLSRPWEPKDTPPVQVSIVEVVVE